MCRKEDEKETKCEFETSTFHPGLPLFKFLELYFLERQTKSKGFFLQE